MELGFCPSTQELQKHLQELTKNEEARFTLEEIKTALPPNGAAGRVSLTLRERGRIVGFKFRAADQVTEYKYLNLEGSKKRHPSRPFQGRECSFKSGGVRRNESARGRL